MKALLLAAGYGSRLQPITQHVPKCLVPINGKPLIEYWLENLCNAGVTEFLINTHYLSEQVEKYIANSKYAQMVTLVYEQNLLFTGGTILENKQFFNNEDFMVIHADNLCFCDFKEFIKEHHSRPEECKMTMMTFITDTPESCGVIKIDKNNILTEFYEKIKNPPTNLANGAVYIFEPSIIKMLENLKKEKIDLSTEVIPLLIGKIKSYQNNIYLKDIGTIESYSMAQIEVLDFI